MGFLSKLWRRIKPFRKSAEYIAGELAKREARKWVEKKRRELAEKENRKPDYFTTPIPGGERDSNGEPYETHHIRTNIEPLNDADYMAIWRHQQRKKK